MNVNDCDRWEELVALRLYDELDGDEAQRLAAHLQGCADCRALSAELQRGLGRLRAPAAVGAPRRASPLLAPLVAFAAGALCVLGWSALTTSLRPPPSGAVPASVESRPAFARDTAPPPARDRGLGAVLAAAGR